MYPHKFELNIFRENFQPLFSWTVDLLYFDKNILEYADTDLDYISCNSVPPKVSTYMMLGLPYKDTCGLWFIFLKILIS